MQTEQISVNLTLPLYRQFSRLKVQGHFQNDQDLLQAAFEALERDWHRGRAPQQSPDPTLSPYMHRPGLSLEDYDT
jgi:hypothetical protein